MFTVEIRCPYSGRWHPLDRVDDFDELDAAIAIATRAHYAQRLKPVRVVDETGAVAFQQPKHLPAADAAKPCRCKH